MSGTTGASCGIVRDLLPLYHDNVCSEESRALVEEHIQECENCRDELEAIRSEMVKVHQSSPSEDNLRSALAVIRRKLFKRRVITILIAAVSTVAIVITVTRLTLQRQVAIPYAEGLLSVAVDENRDVTVVSNGEVFYGGMWSYRTMEKDGKRYNAVFFHFFEQMSDRLPWSRRMLISERGLNDIVVGTTLPEVKTPKEGEWLSKITNIGAVYYLTDNSKLPPYADGAVLTEVPEEAVLLWEADE